MKKLLGLAVAVLMGMQLQAQESISLTGSWDFAIGDSAKYEDYVMLPGSMLTNDKGNPVTINTPWTGSLYDSSYYYNPI